MLQYPRWGLTEWVGAPYKTILTLWMHPPSVDRLFGATFSTLPKLSENGAILTFCNTLERSKLLNNVDKVDRSRYLPAQLNSKANKVLAGSTMSANRQFWNITSWMLTCTWDNSEHYVTQMATISASIETSLMHNETTAMLCPTRRHKLVIYNKASAKKIACFLLREVNWYSITAATKLKT